MTSLKPYASSRRVDEDAVNIKESDERIRALNEILGKCSALHTKMNQIFNQFDEKLTTLETVIQPVRSSTQGLMQAQKNIATSMQEVDRVVQHYKTAKQKDAEIATRDISTSFGDYLDWVGTVRAAIAFFSKNSMLKNAEKRLKRLREVLKKAMTDCEHEFERLLSTHNRPIDMTKTSWPFPENFELVPAPLLIRLSRLTNAMDASECRSFLPLVKEQRSNAFKSTLKKVSADGTNAYQKQQDEKSSHLSSSISSSSSSSSSSLAAAGSSPSEEVGRFARGTHRSLFILDLFVRLVELEHELYAKLMDGTTVVGKEFDAAFAEMVDGPLDTWLKVMTAELKEKSGVRILVLLDVYGSLDQQMGRLRNVIKREDQVDKLLALKRQVTARLKKALEEFAEQVEQHVEKTKKLSSDGTIHTLTIETLNFLKRLSEHKATVSRIPASELTDEKNEAMLHAGSSVMAYMTLTILIALGRNLQSKARTHKLASLAAVFLLNNYHYLAKQIKKLGLDVGPAFLNECESEVKRAREAYISASWDKAVQCLDVPEAEKLRAALKVGEKASSEVKKKIKTKFTNFNAIFEALYDSQRFFSVPDSDLRAQLRNDNVERVLPRYKEFLSKLGTSEFVSTWSSQPGKYIKYKSSTLETMLNKFFDEEV